MATSISLSTVQSLYVAYYGRPADPAGLSYWAQRLEDNGGDTTAIIKAFGDSAEYVDRFSDSDSATLVNNLYRQLFGRDAEDTGRDFYVNMLESGEKSLAEIALTISNAAQGSDSEVFAGRVEVADAFTKELDTAEEIAAYSTERGIGIGKNYLEEVTVTNTATKVLNKTIETVATLLPTTPGDGGTGGGGGGTPAPTFTLAVDDSGVLTFGGTATGEISVSAGTSIGEYNFTRGGVTTTLEPAESVNVTSVNLGAADIRVPGSEVSLLTLGINGSGNLTITDVAKDVDLSSLSVDNALNVTLEVTESLDITGLDSSWIDNLDLAAGTVVTMTVAQYNDIARSGDGSYALEDTADNLAPDTDTVQVVTAVADGINVAVTGAVSLNQLQALDSANGDGALTYTTVSGTAAELVANAKGMDDVTYIVDGVNVVVTDSIAITELDGVKAEIGDGTVTAQAIEGSIAELMPDEVVIAYVGEGTNVTVTGSATIEQIKAIDDKNGNGDLTVSAIEDSVANLVTADGVSGYIKDGIDVTITDAITLAQLGSLDTANGGGALTYTTVSGTASALVEDANSNAGAGTYVTDGKNVVVTGEASLTQLDELNNANGAGDLSYTTVSGTAAELVANSAGHVKSGVNVVVTDAATVDQLNTLKGLIGSDATLTVGAIEDSVSALVPTGNDVSDYVTDGVDVTVTDSVTIDQIAAIDAQNGDGELTYALTDSYSEIADDLADDSFDYLSDATAIQLSDYTIGERSVADIQALLALNHMEDRNGGALDVEDLSYTLKDTAANLASSSDDMDSILAQATSVTASTDASVSQAKTIYARDNAATYNISDSASSLANGDSAAAVTQAGDLTATTTATAAQATTIAGRDGSVGTLTYNVADTYASLTANSVGVNSAKDVTVNWSGDYLTTTQAGDVVDFTNTGLTSIPYIRDSAAAINSFVSTNQENGTLHYDFYVEDTAANIITQIGDASADNLYFAKGNADIGIEGDQSVAQIHVTDTFTVGQSEAFWVAINPVFDSNVETTAGKTDYRIDDAIGSYDDETVAQDWITKSDQLGVSGTAADIYAAQNGSTAGFDDIFALMNSRYSDYIRVTGSTGSQTITGAPGSDTINVGADNDWVDGKAGNDTIRGDAGYDQLYGGDGDDTIYGGDDSDVDYLYGGSGRDTIYAADAAANTVYDTARYYGANQITGGEGGDNMYGSTYFDTFYYAGSDRSSLINESGTTQSTRDYITNFGLGDRIVFSEADSVQYFGSGSANASAVDPGTLGLSIRYEKDVQVLNWNGNALTDATRILVDIADQDGQFDDVADMQVILVGGNIDVNWDHNAILYGG
ncbi:DUF4214 domain-containing protein [Salinicola sp. MIT1003]|uniref:DUF4214 domain-containing protein n=1 Tax=Salinicola sp. MIT1003 TaxID=1882734 RepID=UPI0008DDAC2D|nr:DUF4214 domain-containing protein [Salinicola sp. MIT1003]OHY98650.1 hypothetical protein BC443_06490 [Salinicola sp. MIT1003]